MDLLLLREPVIGSRRQWWWRDVARQNTGDIDQLRFALFPVECRSCSCSIVVASQTTGQEHRICCPHEFRPPLPSESGGYAVDTLDNPITQVLNAYKAAVFAKDVDAFLSLYDVDVLIYDMWGVWSYN